MDQSPDSTMKVKETQKTKGNVKESNQIQHLNMSIKDRLMEVGRKKNYRNITPYLVDTCTIKTQYIIWPKTGPIVNAFSRTSLVNCS